MKKWTKDKLESEGFKIENCKIVDADLSIEEDRICGIRFNLTIDGEFGSCNAFGAYKLGHMEFGDDPRSFTSDERSMVFIMNILNLTRAKSISDLKGKYIRIVYRRNIFSGIIGNIIHDEWFDFDSFWNEFEKDKKEYEEESKEIDNNEEEE